MIDLCMLHVIPQIKIAEKDNQIYHTIFSLLKDRDDSPNSPKSYELMDDDAGLIHPYSIFFLLSRVSDRVVLHAGDPTLRYWPWVNKCFMLTLVEKEGGTTSNNGVANNKVPLLQGTYVCSGKMSIETSIIVANPQIPSIYSRRSF